MDTTLIDAISALVERACASEKNKIGYEIWKYHIKPMVAVAQELAVVHKADEEIVTLAVLLHDSTINPKVEPYPIQPSQNL